MSDSQLSLFAGALLSLAFSYIPKLKDWFEEKDATTKRLIMAGALLAVSLGVFGMACADLLGGLPIQVTAVCDRNGAVAIAVNFLIALVANQATFMITPQPKAKTVEDTINGK